MARTSWGFAALAAAGLALSGCSDDGDTVIINIGSALIPTRADSVATSVELSWSDNHNSINPTSTEEVDGFRNFACCDGAGIIAWTQGDDGSEHMFLAYYGPTGGVHEPVRVTGDFDSGAFGNDQDDMTIVWTPSGDAVIAFVAGQDADVSNTNDTESERVYYGTFTRSQAARSSGAAGQRFGFSGFTAVDTNTITTDDNNVNGIFAASNLINGQHVNNGFDVSGSKNDNASNLTPFIFIGWNYLDSNDDQRVEGYFVDLQDADNDQDLLELTSTSPTQISFSAIGTGENVDNVVWISGRDMVFRATDESGTADQDRLYLVRVDTSGTSPSLGSPIEISRGTNTNAASNIGSIQVLGDGYRAYNGQDSTWVIYESMDFEDATVTQNDDDLMIAQIDDAGAVTLDEFDHNAVANVNTNDLQNFTVQVKRGATRAFIYYQQSFDTDPASNQTNDALFVRALRLNGAEALADNVSAESTINGTQDSDDDGDTDVTNFTVGEFDPFCDADVNNDASYVAFVQEIDGDLDGVTVRARLVTIDDITVSPITITLGTEETVFSNVDTGWDLEVNVLQGSASTGQGLVFAITNGNNISDDGATGSFDESRPFLYAAALPNSQSITTPLQIGHDSSTGPGIPFPDFYTYEDNGDVNGIVTPRSAAQRDFAFDDDTATPQYAVIVYPAFFHADGNDEEGSGYFARRIDLQTNASFSAVADRFSPALTEFPSLVSPISGYEFEDIDDAILALVPQGNNVVAIFNIENHDDDGNEGQLFVNTLNNGTWSDAALLSNDREISIEDDEEPFFDTGENFGFGVGYDSSCCPTAVGTWVFWLRQDYDAFSDEREIYGLQGRRITGTNLTPLN